MSRGKKCPCGCGTRLGHVAGREQVVCTQVWMALPPGLRDKITLAMQVDPRVIAQAHSLALELARTIKRQRPKPAVQGELWQMENGEGKMEKEEVVV